MSKNKNLLINFYNLEGRDIAPIKFAGEIIKQIKSDGNENVIGFGNLKYLKQNLLQQLGNKNIVESKVDQKVNKEIEKYIVEFIEKFQKELRLKYKPLRIYVYPWFPDKKDSKEFNGINAVATYFTVIHLYIDYKNFTKKSLEQTLAHELNHLYFYQINNECFLNIKQSIIAEGLAEHYREYLTGGKIAPWSKKLSPKKIYDYLPKIQPYFNSKNRNVYNDIFYGGKKFPRWTGYSVGYELVGERIKRSKSVNWKKIMNTPVDSFF